MNEKIAALTSTRFMMNLANVDRDRCMMVVKCVKGV